MLTAEDIRRLSEMSDPAVNKLLEFYEATTSDPSDDFYASLCMAVKKITKDIKAIHGNEDGQFSELDLSILNRDDKIFERIMSLFKESDKIFSSINRGKGREEKPIATPQAPVPSTAAVW